ncbi:MAG: class I SAM-dependent methyltransferase [Candidatus Magasanikbacteria bacterium]|nr:class I SAM-dependent methyltransferase [Candidatus Magasanikbacteria bacterium]
MIKKISILLQGIFKPMPLDNNFKDYDEYWENRGFHAPSLGRAKIISTYIEPDSKILDIGCGDGTIIEYLSKNNKPKEIVGIDISKKAVEYVKKKGFDAFEMNVLAEDFTNFLAEKKFDYIILTEVLEHIQDPEKVILAIKNHFDKSVFVSIPNAGFLLHRLRLLFGRFPLVMIQQNVKEHIRFWTLKDFIYWSNYHGFEVELKIVSCGLGYKPFIFLENLLPSLFANQILYKLKINEKLQ